MVGDVAEEVGELREAFDTMIKGLMNMLRIQAQHGAILKEILAACAAEPEEESPLVRLIKQQIAEFQEMRKEIAALPVVVARAVMDGELSGRG